MKLRIQSYGFLGVAMCGLFGFVDRNRVEDAAPLAQPEYSANSDGCPDGEEQQKENGNHETINS